MIKESLFLRMLVAFLVWIITWAAIGTVLGYLAIGFFFDSPMQMYSSLQRDVSSLMPLNILDFEMSQTALIESAKQLNEIADAEGKRSMLRIFFGVSSAIGFILSSFIVLWLYRVKPFDFLKARTTFSPILVVLVPILFIVAAPIISWTGIINESFSLPAFLSGTEIWMREMEFQNTVLSIFLADGNGTAAFLSSILVMAVVPAVGEELLFRGIIQKNLIDFDVKPHYAILITAFLFSAMHMQFYGFLPRFALGVLLGCIYYWSGSIWPSILGHFTQNAFSVFLLNEALTTSEDISEYTNNPSAWMTIGALLLFTGLIYLVIRITKQKSGIIQKAR